MFNWEDVSRKYPTKLINFLINNSYQLNKVKSIEEIKDGKGIIISDEKYSFSFKINTENNTAIISTLDRNSKKIKNEQDRLLAIEIKSNKLNIYEYKFGRTLEISLSYLWILGYYLSAYLPEYVENINMLVKNIDKDIRYLFESNYIQEIALRTADISEDNIKNFKELYYKG